MDADGRYCLGCFRTLDEIAAWSVLDADAKRARAGRAAAARRCDDRHVPMIADWYFDFVSPFAYLQSEQLGSLAPRVSVRYRPVLFAGLLGAHGQKGPAEIPAKRTFTYRFCIWQAKRARHPASGSRPSIRSIRCRCCGSRSPAIRRRTPCTGSSASSGATAGCPICRSNGRSSSAGSACATPMRASRPRT